MPVTALFALQAVGVHDMIGEDDLAAVAEAAPERLPTDYITGQLLLLAPGQPAVAVHDDLEVTAQQWLEAIPELVAGRSFEMYFSDAPGNVRLVPADGTVMVSGDTGSADPFVASMDELLPAVLACWERFQAFALAHLARDDGKVESLHQLDHWFAQARSALAEG